MPSSLRAVRGRAATLALALAVWAAAACTESQVVDPVDPPPAEDDSVTVSIYLAPESAELDEGDTLVFVARGRNLRGDTAVVGVDWRAAGASISAQGAFASDTVGDFLVIATGRNLRQPVDTAAVRVRPRQLVGIDLSPTTTSLPTGATQQFAVVGRLGNGGTRPVTPTYAATGGTISNSGLYTAGSSAGTFRVIATASGFADTATVTITAAPPPPPTLVGIELTPATATVQAGATQQFAVVGRLSNGGTQAVAPAFTATGGTVSTGGLFTAGGTAGSFRVVATASGFADTATVTVTAAPPPPPVLVAIELTPTTVSVQTGATQQFSVIGRLSDGGTQAVTPAYTATGGTISTAGLYTAGATTGSFRVISIASGFADTASVTITAAPPPPPTLIAIELTPATASLQTGATQQFSVVGRLSDGGTQAVTPAYAATGGTISGAGLYTAGGTAGSFRVIATANGFADTAAVTLTAPAPTLIAIELTPATVSLQTGATQQFAVVGRLSNGGMQAVTPAYTATGGTISGGGLYTAGAAAGSFQVIATANGFADTASVTLTLPVPTLVAIELTPATVSLPTGATQQFSVVGRLSNGATQAVTPAYSATGGTVSTSGLYTGGATAGSFRVIATASGLADTAAVTLTAPAPTLIAIELTPATVSLQSGATQQFSVIGRLSNGGTQAVTPTYTATGGTVSGSGLYTAGGTAGSFRVIAIASGFADTSSVTITVPPPTLIAIELTPATVSLATGATQQFSVVGRLSNGGTQAVTPSYTATGGTVSGSGLYTAGGVAGSFRVIATASGLADTASVTLTSGGGTVTLFSENFESNPNLDARFPDRFGQHAVLTNSSVCYGGSRCLEVTFPPGGTGGWLSTYFSGVTSGTLRLTARIQWSAGWSGLSRVAGLKGTPASNVNAANGVAGVCANTGKNGVVDAVDPFFTAVVEIGDNGRLRFYEQYVNQGGTPPGNCYSVIGTGGGMGTATYTPAGGVAPAPGVWHLLEIELRLNDVGQSNGYHRFWLDGQQLGDFPTLAWRVQNVVEFTQLQLDMHASGGSPQLQQVYWDDIVLTHTP